MSAPPSYEESMKASASQIFQKRPEDAPKESASQIFQVIRLNLSKTVISDKYYSIDEYLNEKFPPYVDVFSVYHDNKVHINHIIKYMLLDNIKLFYFGGLFCNSICISKTKIKLYVTKEPRDLIGDVRIQTIIFKIKNIKSIEHEKNMFYDDCLIFNCHNEKTIKFSLPSRKIIAYIIEYLQSNLS